MLGGKGNAGFIHIVIINVCNLLTISKLCGTKHPNRLFANKNYAYPIIPDRKSQARAVGNLVIFINALAGNFAAVWNFTKTNLIWRKHTDGAE